MGRVYVADFKIQQILNNPNFHQSDVFTNVGLVVGQISEQKDYVVHLMKTPLLDDSMELSNEDVSGKKEKISKLSPEKMVEKCISIHAKQVRQMLTGGIDVLGIFVYTTSDDMKIQMSRYKQLLYNVFNAVNKFDKHLPISDRHRNRLLLHICSQTKKLTAKSFNISDSKDTGHPAEWKYQKILNLFTSLVTRYSLRTSIYIGEKDPNNTLECQINTGLFPTMKMIHDSCAYINGTLIQTSNNYTSTTTNYDGDNDDDDNKKNNDVNNKPIDSFKNDINLDNPADNDNVESFGDHDNDDDDDDDDDGGDDDYSYDNYKDGMHIVVDLLQNLSSKLDQPLESPNVQRCGAKIVIHGSLVSRAFVHCKTPVREALKALKTDLIRSLLTRCELVCQDLLQAEEDQTELRVVYETPMRAFAPLKPSPIQFSDYLFQEETKQDSIDRFRDVIGLNNLKFKDINQLVESIPDNKDLDAAENHQLGSNNRYYKDIFAERKLSSSGSSGRRKSSTSSGGSGSGRSKHGKNVSTSYVGANCALMESVIDFVLQSFQYIPGSILVAIFAVAAVVIWYLSSSYFAPPANKSHWSS